MGKNLKQQLYEKLSRVRGINLKKTPLSKRGNIFEISGDIACYLYVKTISHPPHRWGITINTVEKLESTFKLWFIILLYDTPDTGYLISSSEYRKKSQNKTWPDAQGDFKISDGKSIEGTPRFDSLGELLELLKVL